MNNFIHVAMRLCNRIVIAILLLLSLDLNAAAYSQITLSVKDAPLRSVMQSIRKQSGYAFFIESSYFDMAKPVTVDISAPLEEVLHAVFAGQPFGYMIKDKAILVVAKKVVSSTVVDSLITVSGKVTNEKGEPIIGATVLVKGTGNGVTTNTDGSFIIGGVKGNSTLVITSVAFLSREVYLRGKKDIGRVSMKDYVGILDATIVIGYGQSSKRLYTGDITSIKAEEIEKQPVNDPLLALQGRVPGMTVQQQSGLPGASLKIQIRGQNSLNGSEPLYIIDGVPVDPNVNGGPGSFPIKSDINGNTQTPLSAFSLINPNDIASIDVLKDADATSIYGSRGANGVILITTKKGKVGQTTINANVSTGFGRVSSKIHLMNTREYLDMRYEAYKNDNILLPTTPNYDNYDLTVWDTTKNTDWQKELIGKTARSTNVYMSISGGVQNIQYMITGNYQQETSVSPGEFKDIKGGLHLNLTGSSNNNKLKMQFTANYTNDRNTLPGQDFTFFALNLAPDAPSLHNANGELNWATLSDGSSTWRNPLSVILQPYDFKNNNLVSNFLIGYQIMHGLQLKTSVGYNNTQGNTFQGIPLIAINPESRPYNQRTANILYTNAKSWIIEPQITYDVTLNSGKISVLLGTSAQQSSQNSLNTYARGFSDDESLKNFSSATSFSSETSSSEYKYSAVFGRINYNIKDKYILNLNARRDGSSRFGPGNQFGNFGSIGAGWIFSEEKWLKKTLPFISYGKIRASYGTSGNDQIKDYAYLKLYRYTDYTYQDIKALSADGLYNSYFAWEVTKKLELGLELGIFNDRILLSSNYYRNRSGNQLVDATLPNYVGPGSIKINRNATIQNSGFEFSVNTINLNNHQLEWHSGFNLTINKNKLLAYPNLSISGDDYLLDIGEALNRQRVYRFAGVNSQTGVYQFYDKNGKITINPSNPDDKTAYINTMPKFFGGFQNTFIYKGLSIDFLFQFVKQIGRNYISGSRPGAFVAASPNQPVTVLNRWKKQNDQVSIQKFSQDFSLFGSSNNFNESDAVYSDASYLRLKNVSVSYNFPSSFKSKIGLENLILFMQGQNLFTVTNYKGLDPETQGTTLPPLKVFTIGVKVGL